MSIATSCVNTRFTLFLFLMLPTLASVAVAQSMHAVITHDNDPLLLAQAAQSGSNAGAVSNSTAAESALPMGDNDNTAAGKSTVRTLVDDSILTTRIKAAMLANPGVKATEVSVETNSGEVILRGAVSNQPEMEQAEKVAKSVNGVKTVVNKLTLKK